MVESNRLDLEGEKENVYQTSELGQPEADNQNTDIEKQAPLEGQGKELSDYRYAGFWMRFWAYLLDLVVIGSINRIIVYPIFRAIDSPVHETSMFAPISIITAIFFYAYFVLMTKFLGQTVGFGLKVVSLDNHKLNWSTILFREWIGRFISGTILILYFVVGFLPKKQGIHDLFAGTTVVHELK
jgi:uncharacterized RDD family membrane protein YckC